MISHSAMTRALHSAPTFNAVKAMPIKMPEGTGSNVPRTVFLSERKAFEYTPSPKADKSATSSKVRRLNGKSALSISPDRLREILAQEQFAMLKGVARRSGAMNPAQTLKPVRIRLA